MGHVEPLLLVWWFVICPFWWKKCRILGLTMMIMHLFLCLRGTFIATLVFSRVKNASPKLKMAPKEGMKRFLLLGSPLGYPLSIPTQNLDGAKTVPFFGWKKIPHFMPDGNRDFFIISHQPKIHAPFFLLGRNRSKMFPATFASTWIFPPFF